MDEPGWKVARLSDVPGAAAHAQLDALRELVDAARDGNLGAVRRLAAKNVILNHESSEIARELGAEACA